MIYTIARGFFWLLFRSLLMALGGLRVEGIEHLPRHGPVIVAVNHRSASDPPVVGVSLPRPAYFMTTAGLFSVPGFGTLLRLMRGFPVRRNTPDRAALRRAERLLNAGEAVVIFPEGRLSPTGRLQPLLAGVVWLAMRTGVPVVPMGLIGTERLIPYGSRWPRPSWRRTITRFGPAITVQELTGGWSGRRGRRYGVRMLADVLRVLINEPNVESESAQPSFARYVEDTLFRREHSSKRLD